MRKLLLAQSRVGLNRRRPISASNGNKWTNRWSITGVSWRTTAPRRFPTELFSAHRVSFFSSDSSSDDKVERYDERFSENLGEEVTRVKLVRSDPLFDKVSRMLDVHVGSLHELDIVFTCVELMINCCKLQTLEGMKYARDLLDRMLTEKKFVNKDRLLSGEPPIVIPAKVFEKYLFGWAKLAKHLKVAVPRMKEVIDLMDAENEYDKKFRAENEDLILVEVEKSCEPTVYTYNVMLRGFAEAALLGSNAAIEAESMLDTMMKRHNDRGWYTKPNTRSYTHVLSAFANSSTPHAAEQAEQLLERMKEVHRVEKEKYLDMFGSPYNTLDPKANIIQIVTPDHYVYSAVIRAIAKGGGRGSAEKAHALLLELVESKETQIKPDAVLFTSTISALASALSRWKSPKRRFEEAERVEGILWLMHDLAKEDTVETVSSSSDDELEFDEDEEEEHENGVGPPKGTTTMPLAPTVMTYNTVIKAWANSDTREAAPRAEALLQRMLQDTKSVSPDCVSFNSVLNAWARYFKYDNKAHEKAEELLNLQYDLYHSGRLDESAKPNATTYSSVMNAWARSDSNDKVENTRRLLDVMLDKYQAGEHDMKPTVVAFTTVLNAAAHSIPKSSETKTEQELAFSSDTLEQSDPYSIALQTYEEMWHDVFDLRIEPDHLTFATMLNVVGAHTNVVSNERRQMVERVFDEACSCGQASAQVVKALQAVCPTNDLLERVLGSRQLAKSIRSIDQLPKDWTRRVGGARRLRVIQSNESKEKRYRKKRQGAKGRVA